MTIIEDLLNDCQSQVICTERTIQCNSSMCVHQSSMVVPLQVKDPFSRFGKIPSTNA